MGDAAKEAEKALYELDHGKLQTASPEQREAILSLAAGLDALHASTRRANSVLEDFRKSEILATEAVNAGLTQATLAQMEAFHQLIASTPTGQMQE